MKVLTAVPVVICLLGGVALPQVYRPTTLLVPPFSHTLGFYRASKFYLNLYLGPGFHYANPEGIAGAKMKEHDNPKTSSDDHQLTMFAVNSANGQIIYNVEFKRLSIFGKNGSGESEFNSPRGITVNSNGDVYIADYGNNRVVRLKYKNGELRFVAILGEPLNRPFGVCLDSHGRLYVTDTENSRVVVFDSLGTRIGDWREGLSRPRGIAVLDKDDPHNSAGDEFVVVVDSDNSRIQKFSLSGKPLAGTSTRDIGLDEAHFGYCALDRHGNAWVTDQYNNQIHKFDKDLRYIISLGREGTDEDEFISPRGIAIGRKYGQVFISEAEGGQYYWIGIDGYIVGCFPPAFSSRQPGTTIDLYLTEQAMVTMWIHNERGELVRTLTPPHYQNPGEALLVWDGRDNKNVLVGKGEYTIRVLVTNTYPGLVKSHSKKEFKTTVRCEG